MRDLDDEKRIKEYMAAKMKHIKMYHECMNLVDGLDVEKFSELVRADEREKCAKREWVGLTDEEIEECKINGGLPHAINWRLSVKVMEAKLKEKNT